MSEDKTPEVKPVVEVKPTAEEIKKAEEALIKQDKEMIEKVKQELQSEFDAKLAKLKTDSEEAKTKALENQTQKEQTDSEVILDLRKQIESFGEKLSEVEGRKGVVTTAPNPVKYVEVEGDNTPDVEKEFTAATFGSVFHLGAELAFKDILDVDVESSMKIKLSNGWTISGSVDLILHQFNQIIDWKTTTATAISKVHSEGKDGNYPLQMAVYKYLLWKTEGKLYNTSLGMIDKSFSYFKTNKNDQLTFVEVDTYSPEEIEQKLLDATNELQHYIDLDIIPDQCANLWFMKRKGQPAVAMKCKFYCDQSSSCPHYNSDYHDTNALMDL